MKYFLEVFDGLTRYAPGTDEISLKVINFAKSKLSKIDAVLDIGCGVGIGTLLLAKETNAVITAVEIHEPFLDEINKSAEKEGIKKQIKTVTASMDSLDFESESFDLIWCEGAIYNIGFEKGLKEWKHLLKLDGLMAVSELSWLKDNRPQEIVDFWTKEYPAITDRQVSTNTIKKCGYELLYEILLPDSAWENYFGPVEENLVKMKEKYFEIPEAMQVVKMQEHEIDMFHRYSEYFGYVFYILKNA